jgi:hypothetical protein
MRRGRMDSVFAFSGVGLVHGAVLVVAYRRFGYWDT